MPTVNIFHSTTEVESKIQAFLPELKDYIAQELTCGDTALKSEEISVRLIAAQGSGMIAPIEIEITAHAFAERIQRQDEICLHARDFVRQKLGDVQDVRVWLLLPQLRHSWE